MASVLADTSTHGSEVLSSFTRNSTRHCKRRGSILSDMNAVSMPNRSEAPRPNGGLFGALIALLVRSTATLLLAVLVLLEPLVQALLCAIALLAFGTALF